MLDFLGRRFMFLWPLGPGSFFPEPDPEVKKDRSLDPDPHHKFVLKVTRRFLRYLSSKNV